uniref:Uncharacterized protein n=1 Tax=Drosophila melanogaster TaxID=7227 RepID=A1ZB56_DROME|nr:uncharacterized protein Dmel_CG18538 [Drosophila melanogaster]AAF57717.2 uncharacterized protein Dmel_CG18538 [Drosophila melanogaster]|eukprot:NP_611314.2 uncharacterized protein Dmel_CG18538 [Drosophila melanogaster]
MSVRCFIAELCMALLLRKWDYEPISIETHSSDESLIKLDMKIERINRGVFGLTPRLSGTTIRLMKPWYVEANVLRSSTGDVSDYKLLPWAIPKQSLYEHLNTYYKDVSMKNFKHCSNIPQFEGKFQPPLPKQTYFGNKCVIDGDGLPEIVPAGFYLIVIKCYGPGQPTWNTTSVFKITPKLM